jgi:CheY-like chemotaxis protein
MLEGGSETVLLVEDDPLVRKSVTRQLESIGYRTIAAADSAEALAVVTAPRRQAHNLQLSPERGLAGSDECQKNSKK